MLSIDQIDQRPTDGPNQVPGLMPVKPRAMRPIAPPSGPTATPMPAMPQTLQGPTATPAPPPAPPMQVPYASVSAINPQNDLRGTQIAPTSVNRLQFAKDKFAQFQSDLAPQIEAQRRGLLKNGAAMGRIGSGMLRTSFGDLASELNRQSLNEQNRLFTGAAESSVNDDANARNELRGERTYQNAMEGDAFNRARQERMDQEDLLNSSFGRALQRGQFGYGGNPASFVGGVAQDQQARADQGAQSFVTALGNLGGRQTVAKPVPQPTPPYFPEHPYDQPDY